MKQLLNIKGKLYPESSKTHVIHQFIIEDEVKKLSFSFTYNPKRLEDENVAEQLIKESILKYSGNEIEKHMSNWKSFLPLVNLVTISIDDPVKFRGAAHRHHPKQNLIISETDASPGFIPGDILKGEWSITVSAHAVVTQVCDYELSVYVEE